MKKIFIGIQSRLNSTRFPKKAFVLIAGVPLIIRVIKRISQITHPHTIALLTPNKEVSEFTQFLLKYKITIPVFGGSEDNVLKRYYDAALHFKAQDLIMRVTGDNPLISIPLANDLLKYHQDHPCDLSHYIGNSLGTGVEIITFRALEYSFHHSQDLFEKEHVTQYIYRNPHLFHIEEPICPYKNDLTHLSIDSPKDRIFIEKLLNSNPNWDISQL